MDEIIDMLLEIGLPGEACRCVRREYDGDPDGLTFFALYMRAALDDRHEWRD